MLFEEFKKKYSDTGLSDSNLKEIYCLISNYVLMRIYPNENNHAIITGDEADSYFDYFIQGFKIIQSAFNFKFNKRFYEALNFIITHNQTIHYTVLFNCLGTGVKKDVINFVSSNKKKFRCPSIARNFLTEIIYCNDPEMLLKIGVYKSFVLSNGKYLFD